MLKKLTYLVPLALLMAACTHPAPPAPDTISFTRYQPIYLNVNVIDIDDQYQSPLKPPHVEQLIPISPMDAMHAWIRDRLRAVDTSKSLEIVIKDASVVGEPMQPQDSSFPSLHSSNRYNAKLDVELRIYGKDDAMSLASIEVTATAAISIDDKASLAQRRALFDQMIFALMDNMNAALEKNIFQYFGSYIDYSRGI